MFLPMLTMAVAQFFDFGTFAVMVRRHGPTSEANPLVAAIFGDLGLGGTALAKAALVLLVASVGLILAGRNGTVGRRRTAALVVGLGIVGGLVGGITNALTLGPI
jgi:hypothetical protein